MRTSFHVARTLAALVAVAVLLLLGPVTAGPGSVVSGHAQLVSSSPGAGEALDTAPAELRLVFSEPLEAAYSTLDLADASGTLLLEGAGRPDPADPRVLVAQAPPMPDGSYSVTWRSLSAADGHTAEGFFTFAVGAGGVIGGHGHDGGTAHGHADSPADRLLAIAARSASLGGLMLAFGVALLALLLRRVHPRFVALAAETTWVLLLVAAAGAAAMLAIAAAALPGAFDPIGYATGVRGGQLLTARVLVSLLAAAIAFGLGIVAGRHRAALVVVAAGAAAGIASVAAGGHAAAFTSPVPMVVDVVHLAAAGLWVSGVLAIAVIATWAFAPSSDPAPSNLLVLSVSRFSAVALVAVALVGITGAYLVWVSVRSPAELGSDYAIALGLKVTVFAAALVFGAFAFVDGGRDRTGPWTFRTRVFAESVLALVVVVLAANLTTASPPGPTLPIGLAVAAGSRDPSAASLALQPGRPGPNGFVVELDQPVQSGDTVDLLLQRLDAGSGEARVRLPPTDASLRRFGTDGGLLAAESEWDAAVVVTDVDGREQTRTRFVFALDATGVSAGREAAPIDPGVLLALLLIAAGIVGAVYALAGGRLPRTEAGASRIALIAGGVTSGILGAAILVGTIRGP